MAEFYEKALLFGATLVTITTFVIVVLLILLLGQNISIAAISGLITSTGFGGGLFYYYIKAKLRLERMKVTTSGRECVKKNSELVDKLRELEWQRFRDKHPQNELHYESPFRRLGRQLKDIEDQFIYEFELQWGQEYVPTDKSIISHHYEFVEEVE